MGGPTVRMLLQSLASNDKIKIPKKKPLFLWRQESLVLSSSVCLMAKKGSAHEQVLFCRGWDGNWLMIQTIGSWSNFKGFTQDFIPWNSLGTEARHASMSATKTAWSAGTSCEMARPEATCGACCKGPKSLELPPHHIWDLVGIYWYRSHLYIYI